MRKRAAGSGICQTRRPALRISHAQRAVVASRGASAGATLGVTSSSLGEVVGVVVDPHSEQRAWQRVPSSWAVRGVFGLCLARPRPAFSGSAWVNIRTRARVDIACNVAAGRRRSVAFNAKQTGTQCAAPHSGRTSAVLRSGRGSGGAAGVVVADEVLTATKRADEGWYGECVAGGSASAGRGAAITISTLGSHVRSAVVLLRWRSVVGGLVVAPERLVTTTIGSNVVDSGGGRWSVGSGVVSGRRAERVGRRGGDRGSPCLRGSTKRAKGTPLSRPCAGY